MAGITDSAFRVVARASGCELAFTEMVSAEGIIRDGKRTRSYLKLNEREHPAGVQIFGADPDVLAEAARIAQDSGAALVDINMGCPVKKVTRTGSGSALMRDPLKAASAIRKVRKAVSIPLSVKMRSGWRGSFNFLELGRIAESEGANAVILHPRSVEQGFTGRADRDLIAQLKSHIGIPVIGNGDIRLARDALDMFIATGCDGVMAGRGSLGNPWLFRNIGTMMNDSSFRELAPKPDEKKKTALLHLNCAVSFFGEEVGIRGVRKHLCWYARGARGAAAFRISVSGLGNASSLEELICCFFDGLR